MKQNNLLKLIAIGAFCSVPFIMSGCAAVAVGAATGTTGAIIGSDSRTIDSMFYDETIEQNAYKIFKENEKLSKKDDFSVSVISMSGNVLLVGQTINSEYFNSCLEKIKRLDYVRKVYNFVTFKQPVSAGVTANDTYITSKIKTKLLFGENIRSGRFKVVTEDSMVYLLGYVTRDEAIRAVNEVQKIDGVKKIYTIFDYMEKIYSCEGHYLKKNPLSIARVIKPTNREDSILIGDSLSSDIAFANNAGIDSIWFNPSRTKNLTSLKPTFEITSLLEVLDIIQ